MAKFHVPLADGTYSSESVVSSGQDNETFDHQLSFKVNGSPTGGTITVRAKAEGSDTFENVPSGVISLTSPRTLLFQFHLREYQFVIAGSGVSNGTIVVSDVPFRSVISGGD